VAQQSVGKLVLTQNDGGAIRILGGRQK